MSYPEVLPEAALAGAQDVLPADRPWQVRWDILDEADRASLLRTAVPETVTVRTSGSTGSPRSWSRTRTQLLAEAGQLAALWSDRDIDAVLAFAPPVHLYGLLTTVVLPATLGVPVFFVPSYDVPLPPLAGLHLGVAAIPWTFPILERHRAALTDVSTVSILHSTAKLPATAAEFTHRIGADRVSVTEIFGSTETGGVAHRRHPESAWTLFDDVSLVNGSGRGEVPLVVSGPRLAESLTQWDTGDFVEILDDRRLLFRGRRARLRKINGVRVDLDEVQRHLFAATTCTDLACLPVDDPLRGESFSVLVVADDFAERDLEAVVRAEAKNWGLAPHEVLCVPRIDRTETGKIRG
ncbi:acyl--CoA ligase [Streptomyces sp. NBC_00178]|uniref:class I adenylate-forming enzyme family protein n=1 Tax=Streptomyces sp. NBC_00178 TaxID=2975672 RepID=UPI002E294139|nr:class I adenylate-forming enzyme family protein [Streptomyces sp. NBC_00178]